MSVIRLLVELDFVLDTRLATVDCLDPGAAVRLAANPAYYERTKDLFEPLCGIDEAAYQSAWAARGVDTLRHALVCPSIDLVHYALLDLERRAIVDPSISGVALDVNVWPYQLTDAEAHDLALAMAERAGYQSPVRLLCQPPAYFTPTLIRQSYAGVLLYDHHSWFKLHADELLMRVGIPQVTMVVPKLVYDRLPTAEELELGTEKKRNAFEIAEYMMLPHVGLEYIDTLHCCIATLKRG